MWIEDLMRGLIGGIGDLVRGRGPKLKDRIEIVREHERELDADREETQRLIREAFPDSRDPRRPK